jgi:filamentous hemagglutinin family protein
MSYHSRFSGSAIINGLLIPLIFIGGSIVSGLALGAPAEGQVIRGSVSITYDPPVTRIVQQSEEATIEWQGFNLANGERVEIVQPSHNSRLINHVVAEEPTEIEGDIQSNGQVFLINPHGIHHQESAHARVGGLILSGLIFESASVMAESVKLLSKDPDLIGTIINSGTIETAQGGNAALVGRRAHNNGLMTGEFSSMVLAVGRAANIYFEANGLINLNVDQEEPKPRENDDVPLSNFGEVITPSGRIFVTATASPRIFKLLNLTGGTLASDSVFDLSPSMPFNVGLGNRFVNRGKLDASNPYDDEQGRNGGRVAILAHTIESSGPVSATTLHSSIAGKILIAATDTVNITEGGDLNVDPAHDEEGGAITILGKTIRITDVSISANEGGQIIIGGEGTNPVSNLGNTKTLLVNANIYLYGQYSVSSLTLWSGKTLDVAGEIKGTSHMGADVKIISGDKLRFDAMVDIPGGSRNPSQHGTLLLQAQDIKVSPLDEGWTVNAIKLDQTLDAGNVTLLARRNLTLTGSPFTLVLSDDDLANNGVGGSSLSLSAGEKLLLQDVGILQLGTKFGAGCDINIVNTTFSFTGCDIDARRNLLVNDSVFIGSCTPETLQAGGVVKIQNSIFF